MRVLGTFVNFGSASDHLYWQGHVMRSAWRERRRLEQAQQPSPAERKQRAAAAQSPVRELAPCVR